MTEQENKTAPLVIDRVTVSFDGVRVLEDVSFEVGRNDVVAVLGPNGAGKSTLLKAVLGLICPERGSIRIFGEPPEKGRRFVGYLPQYASFDKEFPISVFDMVLMARYRGIGKVYTHADRVVAERALGTVGVAHLAARPIHALSGGERQRALLARALAREPKVLLLDEPTASVDPEGEAAFYDLIEGLRKEMAVVMVTHDIGVVSERIEKMACINRKLLHYGSAAEGLDKIHEIYCRPVKTIKHMALGGSHGHEHDHDHA